MSASNTPRPNERLRQARWLLNLSQPDLAEKLGTTVATVNRWERGTQQPGAYYRKKLCDLFDKSAEELGLLPDIPDPQSSTEIDVNTPLEISSLSPSALDHHPDAHSPPAETSPLSVNDISPPLLQAPQQSIQQQQNRISMLRILRRSYRNLVEQSLHGMMRLQLGLAQLPDAVQNATNLLLRVDNHNERPLPPGTTLLQAYDEAEYELLILGAPGAGKSTLLRELALQLVERAEQHARHPVPVIVPLSSWAQERLPLEDWVSKQVSQLYGFSEKLIRRWIEEEQFIFLLDGLDEMEEAARPLCIAAINVYHHAHLVPLVVCSRFDEYEHAARKERLYLQCALVVQPLSLEQVQEYMRSMGPHVEALSAALHHDANLQKLSTTPLMLSILTLAYHDQPIEDLLRQSSLEECQRLIFSQYVARMFSHHHSSIRFPSQPSLSWLCILARQLRTHNQTVFYLEHLHPGWLPPSLSSIYRWLGIYLPAILLGTLASLIIFLFLHGIPDPASLPLMSLRGVWFGSLFSLSTYVVSPSPSSAFRIPRVCLLPFLLSVSIGLLYALYSGVGQDDSPALWLRISVGACLALICYALLALFPPSRPQVSSSPRLRLLLLRPRTLLISAVLAVGLGLTNALCGWLSAGQFLGLSSGLDLAPLVLQDSWFLSCLLDALTSWLSALLLWALLDGTLSSLAEMPLTERVRWTGRSLLLSLFSPSHLRFCALLSALLSVLAGLIIALDLAVGADLSSACSYALILGPCFGLSIGLGCWLVLGLFQGVAQERLPDHDRRLINEGIRLCVRNSLLLGLLGGCLLGLFGLLSMFLNVVLSAWLEGQPDALSQLPAVLLILLYPGLLLALLGACFLAVLSGGLTLWRHYLLRLLLARARLFPWAAPDFLVAMQARLLVLRVGGGYAFIHRLLLDYFADLDPSKTASSSPGP